MKETDMGRSSSTHGIVKNAYTDFDRKSERKIYVQMEGCY
jgi:hypothetical protein